MEVFAALVHVVRLIWWVMSEVQNGTDLDFSADLGEVVRHMQIYRDRSRGKDREIFDLKVNIAET